MAVHVNNIFTDITAPLGQEQITTLRQSASVKIERIVSQLHCSPPGFWYDQADDEWVIVLRGHATLEFLEGEPVDLKEGDFVTIPRRVKHRIQRTDSQTVWLAVKIAVLP
jgi:cupin 2 domain-containing protein